MISVPFVSIVIPCRDEEKFISKCLDSIIDNDYPQKKLEILIVDGMSVDGTRKIVNKYSNRHPFIKLLENPKKLTPSAFNKGVTYSKGEIVMLMGSHSTYEKDYISKCVKYLREYNADNVGGIMMTLPRDNTFIGKSIVSALSSQFGVGGSVFRTGTTEPTLVDTVFGGCYEKRIFERIGLFNENLVSTSDMEFNSRLRKMSGKILLFPDIASYYYTRSDFKSFCKNNLRNGFWAIYPFKYAKMPVSLRHLVPFVFVSSLIGLALLSAFFRTFLLLFLLVIGSYTLTNLYFSHKIAIQEKNLSYLFIMPIIFTSLHVSYGLGSIWGGIKLLLPAGKEVKSASKRLFDIVFSSVGLLFLSPLFLLITIFLKRGKKDPVFYKGERVGQNGKLFKMYKFRTMHANADKMSGGPSCADDDPRITKSGRFLRKYKLNELPQLINVLKGEMSFVGPRPEVKFYTDMFTDEEKEILRVKPGITDWASIWNPDEGKILAEVSAKGEDPEKYYAENIRPQKIKLQLDYVANHSFWVDMKIMFKTFQVLFK